MDGEDAEEIESLRSQWSTLYAKTLPQLARARDPVQPKWPVTLDHCFARIILDNTIGCGEQQWDNVIKKPAVRNMSTAQLRAAIELGHQIQHGDVDLVQLDQQSLHARGKGEKKYKSTRKHSREDEEDTATAQQPSPRKKSKRDDMKQSILSFTKTSNGPDSKAKLPSPASSPKQGETPDTIIPVKQTYPNPNTPEFLSKIRSHSGLTPYRKRLYSVLLSVPSGSYTTYQAMATFMDSSARAVGNGMRNNPFAPDVPCHRVLASDGTIGGFYGSWGEEGKHAAEKKRLLNDEGVKFDSRAKVKGPIFRDFEDLLQRKPISAD